MSKFAMVVERAIECVGEHKITTTDLAVYSVLALHSNRGGYAWPSVSKIERFLGLSRRTVFRSLNALERARLIRRESREADAGQNKYRLNFHPTTSVISGTSDTGVSEIVS